MNTFLLTWNPSRDEWSGFADDVATLRRKGVPTSRWSCGNNQSIARGDRVFLLRQGTDFPGVLGSGWVGRGSHRAAHWEPSRRRNGEKAWFVVVAWDTLVPKEKVLPRILLLEGILPRTLLCTRASGVSVPSGMATKLEERWAKHLKQPQKLDRSSLEAARKVFDRLFPDAPIRRACIEAMADSASVAHATCPNGWSITLSDGMVRLNVGRIEVLTYFPGVVHCIIDRQSFPLGLSQRQGIEVSPPHRAIYNSVPASMVCEFRAEFAVDLFPILRSSHADLIRVASDVNGTSFRRAYSSAVIDFISSELGRQLRHPAYYVRRTRTPISLQLYEGAPHEVIRTDYVRDPEAREQCIKHYGCQCSVCGLDFERMYGHLGAGFIHVHHLDPLSDPRQEHKVDPIADLRPVCPNCHAMIHRGRTLLSIEDLRMLIRGTAPPTSNVAGSPRSIRKARIPLTPGRPTRAR